MSERKTVRKVFFVWDFEKEEQWLNAMAMSGWILSKVGFCRYEFVPCQPGEYTVRLAMHERDEAYISFVQETGAEYIDRILSWHYYRCKSDLGHFDIFSDISGFCQHSCINNRERNIEKLSYSLGHQGLTRTGRTHHENIRLL